MLIVGNIRDESASVFMEVNASLVSNLVEWVLEELLRYICALLLCLVCVYDLSQVRPGGYMSTLRCSPKHSTQALHVFRT